MNNLLIQPAQLAVKTIVPGTSDGPSTGVEKPSGPRDDRSFEKTLQKARRKQGPDEQEQTLASETLPGQPIYAQAQPVEKKSQAEGVQETGDPAQAAAPLTGSPQTANLQSVQSVGEARILVDAAALAALAAPVETVETEAVNSMTVAVAENAAASQVKAAETLAQSGQEIPAEATSADSETNFADLLKNAQAVRPAAQNPVPEAQKTDQAKTVPTQPVAAPQPEAAPAVDLQSAKTSEPVSDFKVQKTSTKDVETPVTVIENSTANQKPAVAEGVNEPARMAEARQVQVLRQVTQGVETMTRTGQNTLRLQLFPENMGKIDLRMTISKEGMVVTLLADTPATGSVLSQHLPELRVTLAEAGVNIAGLSVNSGNVGGQYAAHDQRQAMYSQQQQAVQSPATDKPVEDKQDLRLRDPNANVDYLV